MKRLADGKKQTYKQDLHNTMLKKDKISDKVDEEKQKLKKMKAEAQKTDFSGTEDDLEFAFGFMDTDQNG